MLPYFHRQAALGKALKMAHNRLCNHQLVNQLLNAMAPLRVSCVCVVDKAL